ncbi:MAG: InlB B-repeat-containing protein, partial [Candidatus Aenigmatarchaeota archaeon]
MRKMMILSIGILIICLLSLSAAGGIRGGTSENIDVEENKRVNQPSEEYGVNVEAPDDQTENESGEHTYSFTVNNTGAKDDTYDLKVDTTNPNFTPSAQAQVSVEDWIVSAPEEVVVPAGDSALVGVNVTIPDGAGGVSCEVTLTATSQNGSEVSDSDSMNITFAEEEYAVEVFAPSDAIETETGNYTYDFTVDNRGIEDDTYNLTVESSNESWPVNAPEQVSVNSGGEEIVPVEVTIPTEAEFGDESDIMLTAISQNDTDVVASDWMNVIYAEEIVTLTAQDPAEGTIFVDGTEVTESEMIFEYPLGAAVDIEAVPDEGYRFVEWTGDNGTI